MITLYTRENCIFCIKAKELLEKNNISYEELIIGKDINREDIIQKFPDRKRLPIIIENDKIVGGYDDLAEYIYPPLNKET